jgi:hypothetical protein
MKNPIRIVALVGMLGAIVLAALVTRNSFRLPVRAGAPAPAGAPTAAETPGEDVVGRALRLAAIDSTRKDEWVDEIPDLDLATLPAPAREVFLRIANGRRCGCGCGFTLAGCRRFDSECEVSAPRAQALLDSVRAGRVNSAAGFAGRPAAR